MTLTLLLDENIPPRITKFLLHRRPAWNVKHVREAGLRGLTDGVIFAWAQEHGAIVITFDEDFADARMYPAGSHHGVIRMRIWPTTTERVEAALDRLLQELSDDDLQGSLIIVDDRRIRVRKSARHG